MARGEQGRLKHVDKHDAKQTWDLINYTHKLIIKLYDSTRNMLDFLDNGGQPPDDGTGLNNATSTHH